MSQSRDSSPVYYREIQKNAYLKRIPDEGGGGKLRPLALKKTPLKPMWTQLCVHNGRTPYLEQYRDPTSARAHKPVWRASLQTARHVTASVTPRDNEYDFLIDTHKGPVRMLAPNWETMQDWVTTLRNKLHELKIVPLCENVYNAPPVPQPPRAAARDPTSPLPPTPPLPPDRVPGIDLTSVTRAPTIPENDSEPIEESTYLPTSLPTSLPPSQPADQEIDISNWDDLTLPSTSQAPTSVAKICGQNICLDDSIFKRDTDDSDQDFEDDESEMSYRHSVVVETRSTCNLSSNCPSNVTVIQVSNKEPPHTAIPIIGPEVDVFDFEFKSPANPNYVNIVNTENTQTSNDYGTVFNESDYGHLSLTTTLSLTGDANSTDVNSTAVNFTGDVKQDLYEKLCLASTDASPLPIRRLRQEKNRKSSLPNLDTVNDTYEYLFPSQISDSTSYSNSTRSTNSTSISSNSTYLSANRGSASSNCTFLSANSTISNSPLTSVNSTSITSSSSTQISTISTSSMSISTNSIPITKSQPISNSAPIINSVPISNSASIPNNATMQQNTSMSNSGPIPNSGLMQHSASISNNAPIPNSVPIPNRTLPNANNVTVNTEMTRHVNSVSINNVSSNTRSIRSNIERTLSQNSCDAIPRRVQNESKNNGKVDKSEPQHKPIWKRGLTELSLLTRLRGIGQLKRTESPGRNDSDRNGVTSPSKVVHRSRPEARVDRTRRRSSSLTNGESPPAACSALAPLRARQAAALVAAQRRGAAVVACVSAGDPPIFIDYDKQVWVAWWGGGGGGARCGGRAGDRVCGLRACAPRDAAHARQLLTAARAHQLDILFHRVPLGKIYVVNKRDQQSIGLKLDNECNITGVEPDSPAARAGIPPPGKWAVTEVNNRAVNLLKGGEDDMNRLSLHGTEASVLIQPSPLVKKLRSALKGNKTLLGLR